MNPNYIIIMIIIGTLLIIFFGYIFVKYVNLNDNYVNFNNSNDNFNKNVVLFKTHLWNDELEIFAEKIKNETIPYNIDFFILMHSNDFSLINHIKNDQLKKYVMMYSENDIKKIYNNDGFYGMWLSNHWILMWFYQKFQNKYNYYWSIEYDVRISGNGLNIWNYNGNEDFIYPIEPFNDPNWRWKNYYVGGKMTDDDKFYGYLQLARYSNKFLDYLNKHYKNGENGQDELITFSLFKRNKNLTGTKDLLHKLIDNSWSVINSDSEKNKKLLIESDKIYMNNKNHLRIFHPIKTRT